MAQVIANLSTKAKLATLGATGLVAAVALGGTSLAAMGRLDEHAGWRERLGQSLLALVVYGKPSLAAWLARGLEASPAATYAAALGNRPAPT